jgi:hypothetical protein
LRRLSVFARFGLIRSHRSAAKYRHYNQPTPSQLIITNDSVAIVARFALTSESCKESPGDYGPIQNLSGLMEAPAFLRVDRDSRVYSLDNVVWTDSQAVV